MPLGNGDVALNVRTTPDGEMLLLLAKSDAWDHKAHLLKLGQVRIRLDPHPWPAGTPFRQELRVDRGEIEIEAGPPATPLNLRIWVDALRPVVHVEGRCRRPLSVRATLEVWRSQRRELGPEEAHGVDRFAADEPPTSEPDVVRPPRDGRLVWFHRNERSIWAATLRHQGLSEWIPQGRDPLLGRTFGGAVVGSGLRAFGRDTLASAEPSEDFSLELHVLTAQTATAELWETELADRIAAHRAVTLETARATHRAWWSDFWNRSWIRVGGGTPEAAREASLVHRAYTLQRFLNACASRGEFPIKFNGSLFTVEVPGKFDADYRQWGGGYWFQNTRLPYWPMLASGDTDLMAPLFRMYLDALPLAEARTRILFDHPGAYFPETMHFWGTWSNGDMGWGWDRKDEPPNRALNPYIRFHWSGSLELLALMLDRVAFTRDAPFFVRSVLPFADAVLDFYAHHYPRQPDGRILFVPSQALETWWETENPMPEVAGLHHTLRRLLSESLGTLGSPRKARYQDLYGRLPPVPVRLHGEPRWLLPAEAFRTQRNMENPELYAVFPFRLYGVGKPDLPIAVETFRRRQFQGSRGWQQDDTQAALLGLADDARRLLVQRVSSKHEASRFPAFWGPNFDWIPDQDHGGNALMALQSMLLQWDDPPATGPATSSGRGPLRVFPAWPRDWDVDFKLHGPDRTTVRGVYQAGRLRRLDVEPADRRGDVLNLLGNP